MGLLYLLPISIKKTSRTQCHRITSIKKKFPMREPEIEHAIFRPAEQCLCRPPHRVHTLPTEVQRRYFLTDCHNYVLYNNNKNLRSISLVLNMSPAEQCTTNLPADCTTLLAHRRSASRNMSVFRRGLKNTHTHITPLPSWNTYVYTARILDSQKQQLFGDENLFLTTHIAESKQRCVCRGKSEAISTS